MEISAASVEVPSSPASHHQRPAEGNPDASLFVAAHDSAGPARHDCVDREGSLGSVARMRAVCCTGSAWRSLAHSRCCRDRSTNRSGPGRGSGHRDTDAGLHLPACLRHTDVDESPHRWDTAPAYVPRHVVWGAASKQTSRLGSAPCPVFNRDRHLTHLLPLHHQTHRSSAARRIPIPHHSAPCVQPSKEGDGFSVTRADCARSARLQYCHRSQKQRGARRRSRPLQRSQYESQIPERLRTATSRMMQPGPAWRQLTLGAN